MIGERTYGGFTWMGGMRIPPLPPFVILEDRDDGTLWVLAHQESDDRFMLRSQDTAIPAHLRAQYRVYGPSDGPILEWGSGLIRLLVREGRIGYEVLAPTQGQRDKDFPPVYTRDSYENHSLVLSQGDYVREGDRFGYSTVDELND